MSDEASVRRAAWCARAAVAAAAGRFGATATGDAISAGAVLAVAAGGVASGAVILAGGSEIVAAGGSSVSGVVSSGGVFGVASGAFVSATVVSAGGTLAIRLHLRVAQGLPIAEVARQVDHAVWHAIRVALGREVDRLTIRVARLELHPGGEPPSPPQHPGVGPSDLADSGTDVF